MKNTELSIARKTLRRNKKLQKKKENEKKIKTFEGRWTTEEEKLFEKNYKDFLNKKISIRQLKKSIPTRTFLQVSNHIIKMKYYLQKKFSIIMDPKVKRDINNFKNFYGKNSENAQRNSDPENPLIVLNDPIEKSILPFPLKIYYY